MRFALRRLRQIWYRHRLPRRGHGLTPYLASSRGDDLCGWRLVHGAHGTASSWHCGSLSIADTFAWRASGKAKCSKTCLELARCFY